MVAGAGRVTRVAEEWDALVGIALALACSFYTLRIRTRRNSRVPKRWSKSFTPFPPAIQGRTQTPRVPIG